VERHFNTDKELKKIIEVRLEAKYVTCKRLVLAERSLIASEYLRKDCHTYASGAF
jgi:hypothetical protein